jgi:hypothetical protein
VQFIVIRHVENADIGGTSGHPPQMDSLASALQFMRASLFIGFQGVGLRQVQIVWNADVHLNAIQHLTFPYCRA